MTLLDRVLIHLLNEAGNPVPGYRQEDCSVFQGDAIGYPVVWRGQSDVSQLAGKPLRLRFHLTSAKHY